MSLRNHYILVIGCLIGLIGALTFILLRDQGAWLLAAEMGLIMLIFLCIQLYWRFIRPLRFMYAGIDAIQDQDFSVKYLKTGSLEMDRLIGVYNRMIDRIREERLQATEQHFFLQTLIDATPAALLVLDYDDRLAQYNPSAERALQLQAGDLKKPLDSLSHPALKAIANLRPGEKKIVRGEGARQFRCACAQFIDRGFYRRFFFLEDLSSELQAAEKRAYGKVIRMMAHEVNNSVGAINSILQSLHSTTHDPEQREALEIAAGRNDRMNRFMKNFAAVVRLPPPSRSPVDLNRLLQDVARLFGPQLQGLNITIRCRLPDTPVIFSIDRQQVEQALINILKNAQEALPKGGIIELNLQPDPLKICIKNNGDPIPEAVQDRLFTPFFSTKREGQGVGLTLVREILSQHGFAFSLTTQSDGWTVFEIDFIV